MFLLIFSILLGRGYRGYYDSAEIQEFLLQVLKSFLLVHFTLAHEILFFSIREEKFHISKGPCYVLFIIQTPISPNHFTFIFFCCVLPEFFQVKQVLWRKLSSVLE